MRAGQYIIVDDGIPRGGEIMGVGEKCVNFANCDRWVFSTDKNKVIALFDTKSALVSALGKVIGAKAERERAELKAQAAYDEQLRKIIIKAQYGEMEN